MWSSSDWLALVWYRVHGEISWSATKSTEIIRNKLCIGCVWQIPWWVSSYSVFIESNMEIQICRPNRLLIVHGMNDENVLFTHTSLLCDKLVEHAKPYQLQLYSGERHGLRSSTNAAHCDATVLTFLLNNLWEHDIQCSAYNVACQCRYDLCHKKDTLMIHDNSNQAT